MPSVKAHDVKKRMGEFAPLKSVCEAISKQLENERHRVNGEIKNYPTPITACDAQFNYLLEERARIAEELGLLKALSLENLTRGAHLKLLGEFIASSNYIKNDVAQLIPKEE